MIQEIRRWYNELTPEQRLKFAALSIFMGEERVAAELVDTPDIDVLFARVAERVYAEKVV
jgi:hypothetical protein